jgi:flagellar basal-body rod modification protein FlgD
MINAIPTTPPAGQGPGPGQPEIASDPSGLASDFKTFLKMLTAQARYQDPLDPVDSTQYASQLAQFSMVEQQVKTNDALALMFGQMSNSNMAALASWVGMEIRAGAPAYFDGTPIAVSPNPALAADRVELVVLDETGKEVQRAETPASSQPIEWAGVDDDGAPFSSGVYSFRVESYNGQNLILSEPAEIYGKVTEAQIRDGQVTLILEGGQAILSSLVTGLRQAN